MYKYIVFFILILSVSCNNKKINSNFKKSTLIFKNRLSDYNIYKNIKNLTPNSGFISYKVSSELYVNYSEKQRLLKLPKDKMLKVKGNGVPNFPNGSILVKTFYYFHNKLDTTKGKQLIETRLLIKNKDIWNAATYIWNSQQTDANLIAQGDTIMVENINELGKKRKINFTIPNQQMCIACHQNKSEVLPIGPSIRNLNTSIIKNGNKINQLTYFHQHQIIDTIIPKNYSKIINYKCKKIDLEKRARAYLDINCAHCHKPYAWHKANAKGYDLSYEADFETTQIKENKELIKILFSTGAMPYYGVDTVDYVGKGIIFDYLKKLK